MKNQKIIAVVGATGAQDGGLVDAILKDSGNDFKVIPCCSPLSTGIIL